MTRYLSIVLMAVRDKPCGHLTKGRAGKQKMNKYRCSKVVYGWHQCNKKGNRVGVSESKRDWTTGTG